MTTQVTVLPIELFHHVMSFRPTHPVATLIQELKKKFYLCVVCFEKPVHGDNECCSSTCHHQMNDEPYFSYPSFEGDQFAKFLLRD